MLAVENNSVPDPKKINPAGIIEQEFILELFTQEIDNYYHDIRNTLQNLADCLSVTQEAVNVHRDDLKAIFRYLKYNSDNQDQNIDDIVDGISSDQFISFEKVLDYCLNHGYLRLKDVLQILNEP